MAGDGPAAAVQAQQQQQQQQHVTKSTAITTTATATTSTSLLIPMTTSASVVPLLLHPPVSPLRPPESQNTNVGPLDATTALTTPISSNIPCVAPTRQRSSSSAGGGGGAASAAATVAVVVPLTHTPPSLKFQRSRSVGSGLGRIIAVTETTPPPVPITLITPQLRRGENSSNKQESISSRWRRRVVQLPLRGHRWATSGNNNKTSATKEEQEGGGDGSSSNSQYGSILNDDDDLLFTNSESQSQTQGGGGRALLGSSSILGSRTPRISNNAKQGDSGQEEGDDDEDEDEFGLFAASDGGGGGIQAEERNDRRRRSSCQSQTTIRQSGGHRQGKTTTSGNSGRCYSSSSSHHHDDNEQQYLLPLQQVMDQETSFVQRFEGILRILIITLGAFLLGSYFPHYSHYAEKLAEYTVVAWVTCIVILLVARIQNERCRQRQHSNDDNTTRRNRHSYQTDNVQATQEWLHSQEQTALLPQRPVVGPIAAVAAPSPRQQQQLRQQQQHQAPSRGSSLEQRRVNQQLVVNKDNEEETIPWLPNNAYGGGLDIDDDSVDDELPPPGVHAEYVQHGRYHGDEEEPIMGGTNASPLGVEQTLTMSAAETARRRAAGGALSSSSSLQTKQQATRKRSNTGGGIRSVPARSLPPPPTMVTTTTTPLLLPAAYNNNNMPKQQQQKMTHPSLDPYFIVEHSTGRRVYPNDPHRMIFPMDTDYFTGQMMVFIRTPDVDEPSSSSSTYKGATTIATSPSGNSLFSLENAPDGGTTQQSNTSAIEYLADKQRRFEFQWQVRLKKVPTDRVFFSCELERPVKMGIVQRAFVGAAMAFVKSTNNSFHYSISGSSSSSSSSKDGNSGIVEYGGGSRYSNGGGGGDGDNQDGTTGGRYEKPHMAFPVEEGMNRIVATPPGQPVPQLGQEIFESAESIKHRKKGGRVEWNLEDTFTFSLWSAYCDFLEWRCQNLPGIRPFSLNSVIGAQSINLVLYEIPEENEKHMRCDMKIIAEFEMSNIEKSSVGRMAKKWQLEHGQQDNHIRDQDHRSEQQQEHHNHNRHHEDDSGTNLSGSYVDAMMEQDLDVSNADSVEGEEVEEEMELGDLDDETTEEEAAAELGAGIYVQSGDKIALRESNFSRDQNALEDDIAPYFVTTGGGFAVLQEQSSSTIIIEKRGRRGPRSASSKLIKSGDTVSFKLVIKGRKGEEETRYLSIHRRGWYLAWVSTLSKNGYFTIHTHETEFSDHGALDPQSSETQSSYLSFGGSFWLRSRRWSKFSVGVAAEGSSAYGGRMMGLYKAKESSPPFGPPEDYLLSDDGEERLDVEQGSKAGWMKPLQLRVYEVPVAPTANVLSITTNDEKKDERKVSGKPPENKLRFSADEYIADAPVWVEIMNRTERTRQLAYVVRIVPHDSLEYDNPTPAAESTHSGSFVRLRTGHELAEVMRIGLSWRNSVMSPRKTKVTAEREFMTPENKQSSSGVAASVSAGASSMPVDTTLVNISDHGASFDDMSESPDGSSSDEAASDGELIDVIDMVDVDENVNGAVSDTAIMLTKSPRKGRKLIGKLAKTVKTKATSTAKSTGNVTKAVASSTGKAVTSTGKAVVRHTVKVGKGTMAIIPIRTKNPPVKEPNQKTQRRATRRTERDLHVPVRSMRRMDRYNSNLDSRILAGELSAPEQSCRTVSNMLLRMSSLPRSSSFGAKFNSLLSTQMENESVLDQWFLQGGAMKLGVVPNKENGELLCEAVVARCLWESHWREEWAGLYGQVVVFYASLTNAPCLELALLDIQHVRVLETRSRNPLPGYGVLVLETAWLCHYIAFGTDEKLQIFKAKVEAAIKRLDESEDIAPTLQTKNLRSARFWQGFRSSIKSSSSQGKGKWADVASGPKTKPRIIFNNRRMVFDLFPTLGTETSFVKDLLTLALSFSFDSLLEDPQILVKFLDAASQLRNISLHSMNFESHETFCLFVNLYHCLLQHAMLLTVSGPLTKRSCVDFMRTTCYEIGGDVFSLAELQCCVIRGRTSRPSFANKPPYIDVPRKSGAFRYYSLGFTSPRVNFLINSGDVSCPRTVMILHPDSLDEQLTKAAQDFVNRNVTIDESKRIIYIPKVCEVYRSDFVPDPPAIGAPIACIRYCRAFMNEDLATKVQEMLRGDVTVKYQYTAEQYHSSLRIKMIEMI